MSRRLIAVAMASVLSLSAASTLHAAPMNFLHHAGTEKVSGKMVSFTVRNDSKTTLVLKAGEQQMTIAPGGKANVKLGEGIELINVNGSTTQAAGSVVTVVNRMLQGNTLAIS